MSTVTDLESYQQFALQQQAANNAWSAEQAQKQMDFQKEMSNTAHQREVADLKAAGLNPVLSANSGASVPNGSMADTDTSASANVGNILQQVLQAQSAREVANMYNAATLAAAQIAAGASMYGADMSYANSEDHPKSIDEVMARMMLGAATGNSDNKPSGGSAGSAGSRAVQSGKDLIESLSYQVAHATNKRSLSDVLRSIAKTVRTTAPKLEAKQFAQYIQRLGGARRLGVGSQQYIYALNLWRKGNYSALNKFLRNFR